VNAIAVNLRSWQINVFKIEEPFDKACTSNKEFNAFICCLPDFLLVWGKFLPLGVISELVYWRTNLGFLMPSNL